MSELITRRTFLKTTGAAALVAAAGSMLVGCGEGYGATPGNPTLPITQILPLRFLPVILPANIMVLPNLV